MPKKKARTRRSVAARPQSTRKLRRSVCAEVDAGPQSTRKTRRSSVCYGGVGAVTQNVKKKDQLRHLVQTVQMDPELKEHARKK